MDENTATNINYSTSATIGKLAGALATAQGAMRPAPKDATNPHFKSRYADLASVIEACRPHLAAAGLALMQPASSEGKRVTVTTMLVHTSGEWVSSSLTMEARDAGPQSVGSALTYGRRYGISALVGVAADDDDGEGAEGRGPGAAAAQRSAPSRPAPRSEARPGAATETQIVAMRDLCDALDLKGAAKTARLTKLLGRAPTKDITSDEAEKVLAGLRADMRNGKEQPALLDGDTRCEDPSLGVDR